MSGTSTPIQPYPIITTNIVTSFTVSCRSLTLFTNATFTVDSFDKNNNLVSRQVIPITTDQYLEWNNNDEFIIQLMATILGYTIEPGSATGATVQIIQEPTPEPTPEPIPEA
jgi:hypothetical protein